MPKTDQPAVRERNFPLRIGDRTLRIAWRQWGADDRPLLVCCHGLTQNGRIFDPLASALAGAYQVICPDLPGRGDSTWSGNPSDYQGSVYLAAIDALLGQILPLSGRRDFHWLGTSLGGLLGMQLAARKDSSVRRLVLNDIGPFLPAAARQRIAGYVGRAPEFADVGAANAWLREHQAGLGPLSAAQWDFITSVLTRPAPTGQGRVANYDPVIGDAYRDDDLKDLPLWPLWERITCPVLTLRGALSDLLTAETVARMQTSGPGTEVVEIPATGHAPALLDDSQIDPIARWLMADRPPG